MPFFVIGSDGQKYGPAEVQTLTDWAKDGRINRETVVENADNGVRATAGAIPGVKFPEGQSVGSSDAILKDPNQAPKRATAGSVAVAAGQPQSYVAGKPEEVAPYSRGADSASQPRASAGVSGAMQERGPGYNRHIDDGSSKLVNQAWIIIAIGFLTTIPIVTAFAMYSANRALNMGNSDAQTPKTVAIILFILQLAVWLVVATIVVIGLIAARNAA